MQKPLLYFILYKVIMIIKLPHLLNQIFVHRSFDQRHLEIPISYIEFPVEFLEHRNNCPPILNYEGFTT